MVTGVAAGVAAKSDPAAQGSAGAAAVAGLMLLLLAACAAEAHPPAGLRADLRAPLAAPAAPIARPAPAAELAALPPAVEPAAKPVPEPGVAESLTGLASWYGTKFHGRLTASGERYDMAALTAAHQTLPFGSRVRVTNLDNGRSVVVTINDRGPFVESRLIDLSHAAAKQLGLLQDGVAEVRVDVLTEVAG